jgi:hypothetical protein
VVSCAIKLVPVFSVPIQHAIWKVGAQASRRRVATLQPLKDIILGVA